MVEGSGNSARKDMSQSQVVSPQNPRDPHRAKPHADNNEPVLLPTPVLSLRLSLVAARFKVSQGEDAALWMARRDEKFQLGKKRPADGDPDGAQPLTKRFGRLQLGRSQAVVVADARLTCILASQIIIMGQSPVLGPVALRALIPPHGGSRGRSTMPCNWMIRNTRPTSTIWSRN